MAEVADAAGVAKGTTYLYFGSREELIAAVRARYVERLSAVFVTDADEPAGRRLARIVEGLFTTAEQHHDLHHRLFHEAGFSEQDAFAGVRERLTEVVRTGTSRGELAVEDVETTVSFLLHGIHGALVDSLHGGGCRSVERTTEQVVDLVLRAAGQARAPAPEGAAGRSRRSS